MADHQAMSVREVAAQLGIRQHGVLSLIASGELVAINVSLKPGGRPLWRIMPEAFDGFLARRSSQGPAPRRRRRRRHTPLNKEYF